MSSIACAWRASSFPSARRTGCREIAEVHGSRAKAEVLPRQQVEAEVHVLDESVLGDDETVLEPRRVVLDASGKAAPLELGQQAALTELREPHRRPSHPTRPS